MAESIGTRTIRLDFTKSRIHGRQKEIETLRQSYLRVVDSRKPEIVLLRGYAGSGKSVLAETLRSFVPQGFFLSGKYDEIRSPQPFSAIADAFSTLSDALSKSTEVASIRDDLDRKIGDDLAYLVKLVPSITLLVDVNTTEGAKNNAIEQHNWGFERIKVAFRDFIRVLAKNSITIVLFIDDLQWADASSLELLQFVMTDQKTKGLLFLGAYRDDEVDASHQLGIRLREITKSPYDVAEIEVRSLDVDTVNKMIADITATAASESETQELAMAVHQKTSGNAFFTLQFLGKLQDEQVIFWSDETRSWHWDTEKVLADASADNVVDLVAHKIAGLSEDAADLLKVASCFGSYFYFDLVSALVVKNRPGCDEEAVHQALAKALNRLVMEGLVVQRDEDFRCVFAHDKVQQGAYALIEDETERQRNHLRIGRLLQRLYSVPQVSRDWMYLVYIDQLNRGAGLIENTDDRVKLALENLEAATKVVSQAAFAHASRYLKYGLSLMDGLDGWTNYYELQLDLQSTLAEVLYCVGDLEACEECCDEVTSHAKRVQDKFRVYITKIDALGSGLKLEDAISFGFEVLRDLGVPFPKRPNQSLVLFNFFTTSMKLRGKTDEEILGLPVISDEIKLFAMDIISSLLMHAYPMDKDAEIGIMTMRLIQITLKYGLSKHSSRAFAAWAYLQGSLFYFDEAMRFGKLASKFATRFENPACEGRCLLTNSCFVWHLKRPMYENLDSLLKSHQYGMEYGDICSGSLAAGCYTMMYFYSGLPLGRLLKDADAFSDQQQRYKQAAGEPLVVVAHQAALNLMGFAADPVKLTGTAMDQDEYLSEANNANTQKIKIQTLYMVLIMVACYFDDFKVAGEAAEKLWNSQQKVDGPNFYIPSYLMFKSLVCLQNWSTTNERKFKKHARLSLKELEKWEQSGANNIRHRLLLLQAENEALKPNHNPEIVKVMFDEAISMARRSGFNHDVALFNERAGRYLTKQLQPQSAFQYLKRSALQYAQWEARGKVEHMLSKYFFTKLGSKDADWLDGQPMDPADPKTVSDSKSSVYGMGIRRSREPIDASNRLSQLQETGER